MPEGIEVEYYRRTAAGVVGRTVNRVRADDGWYLKGGIDSDEVVAELTGVTITAARRIGKLLLLDTDPGPVVGLRFGMTGRLLVDAVAAIERLEYSSGCNDPRWDRFVLEFAEGGDLRVRDPRRLGGVEIEPDTGRLGPDVFTVGAAELGRILAGSQVALKARLMDQSRLAGLGNLLTDEILWRASLHPTRPAASLTGAEVRPLHRHLRATLAELTERGGSHTGDLQAERSRDGVCPRDGTPLERLSVGGRTTYACPRHQSVRA